MTSNLNITSLSVSQTDKETTINNAIGALDAAITSALTFTWSGSDGLKTASEAQTRENAIFIFAGSTSGTPTFKFGNVQRGLVVVRNTMAVDVDISDYSSAVTITVPTGMDIAFYVTTNGIYKIFAAQTVLDSSTTDVLTATSSANYVTPNALAALWEKGSDIASAATISVGEGGYFHVTGTTTITDIDFAVATNGRMVILEFDGILTLTHNSTTLKLPSGANITTAAGDVAGFVQDNGDNVRCVFYQRADGQSVVSGSFTPASTTEVLTGTDVAKGVTPDALAALWEKGSDIASAATITVGEGGVFHVTGTTTITDIDLGTDKEGRGFWLIFDAALTLTHNGTTLILPTGANITTAAGDCAYFTSEGSDAVRCHAYIRASGYPVRTPVTLTIAASDETTALTSGTAKVTFRMPHAMTLTGVRASLSTAQTSGSTLAIDINESNSSILSTVITIDNGQKTSTTATTPPVISDSSIADDAEITIDIDTVGDGTAKGLKVTLIGYRTN